MALIKCPECGKEISDKSDKCIHCGFPVYMKVNMAIKKIKCEFCGMYNDAYRENCLNCGAGLNQKITNKEDVSQFKKENLDNLPKKGTKNKTVSLLLCIFLGYFGAHKFYEKK